MEVNNDIETVEVSAAEYQAVIDFSIRLAEQNDLVLKSIKSLRNEMVAQAETITAIVGAFRDAVAGMQIVVNVPDQPAPVVNVEQPVKSARKVKMKIVRDRDGNITGVEGTEE